jgi:predicted nucleic acid-binding protein
MSDDIFLLDTNIISNSSKTTPDQQISDWLASQRRVAIPFAAILEVEIGIFQTFGNNPSKALALSGWLEELLRTEFEYAFPTPAVARQLAEMYSCNSLTHLWYTDPDKPKKRRPGQDLFIAATAIVYDFPIATCDQKDYLAIARLFTLPGVFNPQTGVWLVSRATNRSGENWPVLLACN